MKKIDVFIWGMQHIAENHHTEAVKYKNGTISILDCSAPLLQDIRLLCEDIGIPTVNVINYHYGIDVLMDWIWTEEEDEDGLYGGREWGMLLEEYEETGFELWKRSDARIGS